MYNMTRPIQFALQVKENLLFFGSTWESTIWVQSQFIFEWNAANGSESGTQNLEPVPLWWKSGKIFQFLLDSKTFQIVIIEKNLPNRNLHIVAGYICIAQMNVFTHTKTE